MPVYLYIYVSVWLYVRISLLLCSSIFPDHFKIPFMLSPTWENEIPSQFDAFGWIFSVSVSVCIFKMLYITVPVKCHKHNISATISGIHSSLQFLVKLSAGWAYRLHFFDFSFSIADRCFIALPINCERQANNSAWHPVFWTGSLLVKMMMRIKLFASIYSYLAKATSCCNEVTSIILIPNSTLMNAQEDIISYLFENYMI